MDETKKTAVMKTNLKFKPKAGYVYVVTNECLKLAKAKGIFRGKMVKAVKIGNAKDFTSRLGSLNTAVYENFDFYTEGSDSFAPPRRSRRLHVQAPRAEDDGRRLPPPPAAAAGRDCRLLRSGPTCDVLAPDAQRHVDPRRAHCRHLRLREGHHNCKFQESTRFYDGGGLCRGESKSELL